VVALDVGKALISDRSDLAGVAQWLGVRPHTVPALVGIAVSQGRDNADALSMIRPGLCA
jgi:hypothetical protein